MSLEDKPGQACDVASHEIVAPRFSQTLITMITAAFARRAFGSADHSAMDQILNRAEAGQERAVADLEKGSKVVLVKQR